ncbi:MAG: hypothetical protein JWN44_3696 [Myxococcales bacterium]|nr:hypothetical protein [Myxococcales bacterium]
MASRSDTEQKQQQASVDLGEHLHELGNKIERLKTLYEQYFMGIEKMEPQVARKEVTRVMLTLQQQYIRNTALRFKFNTMLQKWNIYITYWNRVLREIENGTYVKHLQKAKRKAQKEGRELPPEMAFGKVRPPADGFSLDEETNESRPNFLDIDTGASAPVSRPADEGFDLEEVWDRIAPTESKPNPLAAARGSSVATPLPSTPLPSKPLPGKAASPPPLPPPAPSAAHARSQSVAAPLPKKPPAPPPSPAAAAPPRPPAGAMLPKIPGMSEQELRVLHQRYVDAQKASGGGAVKYETLVSSLAKQVPTVLSKPGVKGVRFDVTVENGKPVLKAIPQK